MRRTLLRLRPYAIAAAVGTILLVDLSNQWEVPVAQLPNELYDRYVNKLRADGGQPELLALAEAGNAQAQYIYALRHTKYAPRNLQWKADPAVAFKWTSRAAEGHHSRAMAVLGLYYLRGIGCDKDIAKAKEWAGRAADKGQPMGYRVLGDVAKAEAEALKPAKDKAAEQQLLEKREAFLKEAYLQYQRGANAGDRNCLRALAEGYEEGLPDMPRNYRLALDYYTRAALRRDIESIKVLTERYESGFRTPRDLTQAYAWRLVLIELEDGDKDRTALEGLETNMNLAEVLAGQELALKLIKDLPSEAADALARLNSGR